MLLNDYQIKARTTATYRTPFMYPALGLAGESGELIEKIGDGSTHETIQGEIGDVLWYVSNVAYDAGLTLAECVELDSVDDLGCFDELLSGHYPEWAEELSIQIGKVCEVVKKTDRDDAGVLTAERRDKVRDALGEVLYLLQDMAFECSVTLAVVAQANLDKLASRKERGALKGDGDNR